MNPEVLRNAWIEATPRRLVIMAVVLGLVFLAASALGAAGEAPNGAAVAVYAAAGPLAYVLLVFWGARNAAEGVLGEIKDRTWDSQRLSALSPLEMTIGKLFGPTLYVWFGGGICLVALLWAANAAGLRIVETFSEEPPRRLRPVFEAAVIILSGVLAQAAALAVALLHARGGRRVGGSASVLAVLAGLLAVWVLWGVSGVLQAQEELGSGPQPPARWWSMPLEDPRGFIVATFAAFAFWAGVAVWRLMRRELQMASSPAAFAAFALFLGWYVAGLVVGATSAGSPHGLAAMLAFYGALHAATLVSGFLEPKNVVEFRRFAHAWSSKDLKLKLMRTPAPAIGLAMTLAAMALVVIAWGIAPAAARTEIWGGLTVAAIAAAGFLIRDLALIGLFSLNRGARGGAFAAIVALAMLYGVGGAFALAVESKLLAAVFFPSAEPLSILFAWGQAAAALTLARGRWRRMATAPQESAAPAIA